MGGTERFQENGIIQIENLVKRYGSFVALDHLNLNVREGEIFGLLGPNGSGKTTVINCMLALLKYDKGSIRIFGQEMAPDHYEVKKQIGIILQNVAVFDELTVYENIDYFCGLYVKEKEKRKSLVKEAIAFVGLEDYQKTRPKKLSGGLLRRLNIACGIAPVSYTHLDVYKRQGGILFESVAIYGSNSTGERWRRQDTAEYKAAEKVCRACKRNGRRGCGYLSLIHI